MKKYINKVIIISLFFLAESVYSETNNRGIQGNLETTYPAIEGITPRTLSIGINLYINYIYSFLIYISGTIILFSVLLVGIKYLSSGGNPETLKSARKHLVSIVVGTIVLFSSFLILETINISLVGIKDIEVEELEDIEIDEPGVAIEIEYIPNTDRFTRIKNLVINIKEESDKTKNELEGFNNFIREHSCKNLLPICVLSETLE